MHRHGIQADTRARGGWHFTQKQALAAVDDAPGFWHDNGRWAAVDAAAGTARVRHAALEKALGSAQEFARDDLAAVLGDAQDGVRHGEHVEVADGTCYAPRLPGLLVCFDKRSVKTGTEWMKAKHADKDGVRIDSPALCARLRQSRALTESELQKLALPALTQHSFIDVDGTRYRPVVTNPGSKIYAIFEVEDYITEVLRQPVDVRCFYEMIPPNRPAALYLDFDSVTRDIDGFMEIVRDAYDAICVFQEHIFPGPGPARVHLYTSTRASSGGLSKASIHLVCKSLHFASNVHEKLMQRFVFALKHYIGDGGAKAPRGLSGEAHDMAENGVIDIEVYTKFRAFRSQLCCKRNSDTPLTKINRGTDFVIDYQYNQTLAAELPGDAFARQVRDDFRASLVTVLDGQSRLVTEAHVCDLEKMVERARIGLHWQSEPGAGTKAVPVASATLATILPGRTMLRRHELDRVVAEAGAPLTKHASFRVEVDGKSRFFAPYLGKTKRFQTLQKQLKRPCAAGDEKLGLQVEKVRRVQERTAAAGAALDDVFPAALRRVFVGDDSTVKQETGVGDGETFAYVRELVELDLVESLHRFYIERPRKCPYDYAVMADHSKMHCHRSNNMSCVVLTRKDTGKTECFAFCLDLECRTKFLKGICAIHSVRGLSSNVTGRLPAIYKDTVKDASFLQRFFSTPYRFRDVVDGEERDRLLGLYRKEPGVLAKLMQGEEGGRLNRLLYMKFLAKNGWVKLYEKREGLVAPRD